MNITLKKFDGYDDWYAIIRKTHDGKSWWQEVRGGKQLMKSERLSPEACIEGTSYEMKEIANAILNDSSVDFKRCSVESIEDGFYFESPRNSEHKTLISKEDSREFALEVIEYFSNSKPDFPMALDQCL